MKKVLQLSTLLLLVFFYSCFNETDRDFEPDQISEVTLTEDAKVGSKEAECYFDCDKSFGVSNKNNPFDEVGVIHNDILCNYYDTYGDGGNMQDFDALLQNEYGVSADFNSEKYSENVLSYLQDDRMEELVATADKLNAELLTQLLDEMWKYDATNLCVILRNIKNLEDASLEKNDAQSIKVFLMASSVARYSLSFWDPYLRDNESAASKFLEKAWWKKLLIAVADVAGGISGGVTGSAAGPAGTVAGAVVGAAAASRGADELLELWSPDTP